MFSWQKLLAIQYKIIITHTAMPCNYSMYTWKSGLSTVTPKFFREVTSGSKLLGERGMGWGRATAYYRRVKQPPSTFKQTLFAQRLWYNHNIIMMMTIYFMSKWVVKKVWLHTQGNSLLFNNHYSVACQYKWLVWKHLFDGPFLAQWIHV